MYSFTEEKNLELKILNMLSKVKQLIQIICWYMKPVLSNSKTRSVSNITGNKRRKITVWRKGLASKVDIFFVHNCFMKSNPERKAMD